MTSIVVQAMGVSFIKARGAGECGGSTKAIGLTAAEVVVEQVGIPRARAALVSVLRPLTKGAVALAHGVKGTAYVRPD